MAVAKRELGRTGLQVTTLGYGAMELRGAPRARDITEAQAETILNEVLEAGINYIDTSIDYGLSEERIGRYISHRRAEYYLASKCGCLVGAPPTPRGQRGQHVFTRENVVEGVEQSLVHRAREMPEAGIDMPFLTGTIPQVKRLADAFRKAGRPVVYVASMLKPDYSDAQIPYWRFGRPAGGNRTFIVEGTWSAQIVDELKPRGGEHVVVKEGFGGFSSTPLDTILRNMGVTSCVVSGVTTCVCVSTTIRGGVEHNYRMILVKDAVAEVFAANAQLLALWRQQSTKKRSKKR